MDDRLREDVVNLLQVVEKAFGQEVTETRVEVPRE